MVTVCCVCKKMKTDYGWDHRSLPHDELPSHGYCPRCAHRVLLEIRDYRRQMALQPA